MSNYKVLGLGSNVGDRAKHLRDAIGLLEKRRIRILSESTVYETEPIDCDDERWFLNQAICIETSMSVYRFKDLSKAIEREMGREVGGVNAPRTIDIDLLLWGKLIIETDALTVPHPRMCGRKFVLVPFLEIIPDPSILAWVAAVTPGQIVRPYVEKNTP